MYCTALTMTLLALSHFYYKPTEALYTRKTCLLWKAASYLFQLCFFWNFIITLFYWSFIIPNGAEEFAPTTYLQVKFAMDHTLPFTYTAIDWCLNSIGGQWPQIWTNMAISLVYALVNMLFCTVGGQFIYPVLTWDSWQAGLIALSLIPVFLLV